MEMTLEQAAATLSEMLRNAPTGRKAAHVTLFGIIYNAQITRLNIKEILRESDLPVSYHWGLLLGRHLAEYVSPICVQAASHVTVSRSKPPLLEGISANLVSCIRWLRRR